ncbi:TPA: hypothetical protein ENS27_09735, partial [bacterium]|nr:hypothetical protein [bacterium]
MKKSISIILIIFFMVCLIAEDDNIKSMVIIRQYGKEINQNNYEYLIKNDSFYFEFKRLNKNQAVHIYLSRNAINQISTPVSIDKSNIFVFGHTVATSYDNDGVILYFDSIKINNTITLSSKDEYSNSFIKVNGLANLENGNYEKN